MMVMNLKSKYSIIGQIGLCLYFSGVFLAWKINQFNILPQFLDIGFVLVLSLGLIVYSYGHGINKIKNPVVFSLLLLVVFYGFITSLFYDDFKNIIWCLFGFSSIFVYLYIDYKSIKLGYTSIFVCLILLVIYLSMTGVSSLFIGLIRTSAGDDNMAYGLASYTAIYTLVLSISSVDFKKNHSIISTAIVWLLTLIILMISGVRSPLFGFVFLTIFFIYNLKRNIKGKYFLFYLFVVVIGFSLIYLNTEIIERLLDSAISAIQTFFGSTSYNYDSAADSRVYQRGVALDLLESNIFFGGGYKSFWVDFPLLQSASDFGLIFGALYIFVYLIFPLYRSLFGVISSDKMESFFSILYVASFVRLILHGQPLDWQHMHYVIPCVVYFCCNKSSIKIFFNGRNHD
jgi:hypothetical protein